MDGGISAAILVSPLLHLRTADFLSKRWGPPQLLKGTHVFVQGELNTREYSTTIQVPNGKKTIEHEIKRLAVELKADTVRILDRNAAEPSDAVEPRVDEEMPR